MSKIYARQVAPEYQESPLFYGDWPENIEIFGNRSYKRRASDLFDRLPSIIEDLSCVWDNIQAGEYNAADWAFELRDIAPPEGRPAYTREERKNAWPELLRQWDGSDDLQIYCDALGLITGRAWDWCTLRGCVQGDWQYCIYPADDWDGDSLERLEAEYFNTGSEWIIHDGQEAPESPEDIDGYSVYCTGWNDDLIRKEIADAAGGRPEDVKLYKFTGYARIAEYEEA
jgi:hypothetical protein